MEEKLKELKITRHKETDVGKKMGNDIWFHKDYINDFMSEKDYAKYLEVVPKNYSFNILRFNTKTQEIAFIDSPDFDQNHEPLVGKVLRIFNEEGQFYSSKIKEPDDNSLIYHHKWLFVKDDYKGFNVEESKKRSIEWKEVLGVDKSISSRIGRVEFWNNWLQENNLPEREIDLAVINYLQDKIEKEDNTIDQVWDIYTQNNIEQSVSSAKTARIQIPRSYKFIEEQKLNENKPILLDIGCGIGNKEFSEKLNNLGVQYHGCDPFNQTQENNLKSIKTCMNGKADLVTLNSVLNTIPEKEVWNGILKQAENALNPETGLLTVVIYEGEKLSSEKKREKEEEIKIEMTPIKTRDGWQNRMKTAEYLPEVKKVFPNSRLISIPNGKAIVASKNPNLDLTLYDKKKRTHKVKL